MPTFPKLDRQLRFDPRNRGFAVAPYVRGTARKKTLWHIPKILPLDQGREGACVGFGWSAELAVGPIELPVSNASAQQLYLGARAIDKLEGAQYASGASVLAGAKYAHKRGWISGYRWAFTVDDIIDTVCSTGPVVMGTDWYDGMYQTAPDGRITVNGPLVGGHCWLISGYIPVEDAVKMNLGAAALFEMVNSWGRSFGVGGVAYIRVADVQRLMASQGEACIANDVAPKRRTENRLQAILALSFVARAIRWVRRAFGA